MHILASIKLNLQKLCQNCNDDTLKNLKVLSKSSNLEIKNGESGEHKICIKVNLIASQFTFISEQKWFLSNPKNRLFQEYTTRLKYARAEPDKE